MRADIRGSAPQIFWCPTKFGCAQKSFYSTNNKSKNTFPLKCNLPPKTLKPGYGSGVLRIE